MLTHTYPHKPLRNIKMTLCIHQADSPLYYAWSLLCVSWCLIFWFASSEKVWSYMTQNGLTETRSQTQTPSMPFLPSEPPPTTHLSGLPPWSVVCCMLKLLMVPGTSRIKIRHLSAFCSSFQVPSLLCHPPLIPFTSLVFVSPRWSASAPCLNCQMLTGSRLPEKREAPDCFVKCVKSHYNERLLFLLSG